MGEVVYGWTGGVEGAGLPFPIADQSSPNAARDIQYLAERIVIDADTVDPADIPADGPPLAFFGEGRPDGLGDPDVSYNNTAIAAPTGSTYTWTGDNPDLVFGAAMWRKGATDWVCVEGNTSVSGTGANDPKNALNINASIARWGETVRWHVSIQAKSRNAPVDWQVFLIGPDCWAGYGGSAAWYGSDGGSAENGINGLGRGRLLNGVRFDGGGWAGASTTNTHLTAFTRCYGRWPSSAADYEIAVGVDAETRTLDDLRELIEAAESPDHPQHEQLQQLKDELAALTGTKPGENEE